MTVWNVPNLQCLNGSISLFCGFIAAPTNVQMHYHTKPQLDSGRPPLSTVRETDQGGNMVFVVPKLTHFPMKIMLLRNLQPWEENGKLGIQNNIFTFHPVCIGDVLFW